MDITVLESDDGNLDFTHDFEIMESEFQNKSDSEKVSDSFSKRSRTIRREIQIEPGRQRLLTYGTETEFKEIKISRHLNEKQEKGSCVACQD